MIGDANRGFAWTDAILSVITSELHLCGSASMVPIIRTLAGIIGDELEIIEYRRLSALKASPKPVTFLNQIKKGDCVVAFSRRLLFQLKEAIESANKTLRCCLI